MASFYDTVKRKIQNRLSASGVALRADDIPPDDLGGVIENALTYIDEGTYFIYDPNDLLINDWVIERTADIASFLLAERRDNPPGPATTRMYERAIERLEQCRMGRFKIPKCPQRKAAVPVVSGVRVVNAPYPRTVVELYRSTGQAEGYTQERDRLEYKPTY